MSKQPLNEGEYTIIFVKSFRHWKSGKIIRRPDGSAFPLRIRIKKKR